MANLKDVIYLSNEDFDILVSTGTVTINGTTLTYDEDNVYITPEELATQSSDGLMSAADKAKLDNDVVTKTYWAVNQSTGGIVKVDSTNGISINSDHELTLQTASSTEVSNRSAVTKALTPDQVELIVKTGLAMSSHTLTLTDTQKGYARQWIGADSVVTSSTTNGNIKINGTETTVYNDTAITTSLAGKEDAANKTATLSSTPGDTKFPTEKLLYDLLPKVIR